MSRNDATYLCVSAVISNFSNLFLFCFSLLSVRKLNIINFKRFLAFSLKSNRKVILVNFIFLCRFFYDKIGRIPSFTIGCLYLGFPKNYPIQIIRFWLCLKAIVKSISKTKNNCNQLSYKIISYIKSETIISQNLPIY